MISALILHHVRYMVSTLCILLQATTLIQKQLHGVLRLFCVRIILYSSLFKWTEHPRFTRLNPPMGFASSDWSELTDSPTTEGPPTPDGVSSEEEFHSWGPDLVLVSSDGGKTLDWSRPTEGGTLMRAYLLRLALSCK